MAHAVKIVGVSDDLGLAAACEKVAQNTLGEKASAARSQPYYLDVTHPEQWPADGMGERWSLPTFRTFSRQVSRLRRVCSSRMMVMKKYGEAISQERIVGNSSRKEFFLHITR